MKGIKYYGFFNFFSKSKQREQLQNTFFKYVFLIITKKFCKATVLCTNLVLACFSNILWENILKLILNQVNLMLGCINGFLPTFLIF
jgi:hypothetical protein